MSRWLSMLAWLGAATITACAVSRPPAGLETAQALPPGDGRRLLERECLNCHELDALELFSDFYGRAQWRALVETMRANGARLDDGEVDVVAAYLARHFGTEGD